MKINYNLTQQEMGKIVDSIKKIECNIYQLPAEKYSQCEKIINEIEKINEVLK